MFGIKKKQKLTEQQKILNALKYNLNKLCFNYDNEIARMEKVAQSLAEEARYSNPGNFELFEQIRDYKNEQILIELLNRRLSGENIEYITGETEFLGRRFITTPKNYTTAPETEWLIKDAIYVAKNIGAKKILDVGTGNGVLGLTLALEYSRIESLVLSDISPEALKDAKENVKRYQKELSGKNIDIAISSYVDDLSCEEPDIILACLPWGDENNLLESNKKRNLDFRGILNYRPDTIFLNLYTDGYSEDGVTKKTHNFKDSSSPKLKEIKVKDELIYRDLSKMPSVAIHPPSHPLEAYELLFKSIQEKGWNKSIVIFETGTHSYLAVDRILPAGYKLEQRPHKQIIKGTNELVPSITLEGNVSIAYKQRK